MQTRKAYSEEFRREAAMQVIENGYKVVEVGQRLGVSECYFLTFAKVSL